MQRALIGFIFALFQSSTPALAIDFHPVESQELAGGVYEFDDILIPEGVTLTLLGEPDLLDLRAAGDIRLDGGLVGPGWTLRLEAGGRILIGATARIEAAGGAIHLVSLGEASPSGLEFRAGARLCVAADCVGPVPVTGDITAGGHTGPTAPFPIEVRTGNGGILIQSPSAVPEPGTWALLLAGLGLVGWRLARQHPA